MSLASERAALQTVVDAVANLRAYDRHPATITGTVAVVGFPTSYRPVDSSSSALMVIPVSLYVPFGNGRQAEDALEALIDTVITAVHAASARYAVEEVRDFGELRKSAETPPTHLACTLDVTVL